ncbi:protein phosphatase 2C domain-containing protein [Sphingopyxis sp. JAI128]|uniref:PP2C family protein-serine/threonine phosphatase n=1 Tax=Sphingopyxis sp. JAI128 TaxID=2723066 RepID=UPI00161DF868|nr:protein phosphatase 2C domain-containing protein [Sphingopyxis sp. JAI128]MBB6426888.1 protein phosphatase [Sphingopyxis sp. JAI128]
MKRNRTAWIATDTGAVRAVNEDRCFVGSWTSDGRDGVASVTLAEDFWSAAIADGMGGHDAGELASETAIAALQPLLSRMIGDAEVGAIVNAVNEQVFEAMYSPRGRPGMGSTIAAIVGGRDRTLLFNVGDSRIYLLRNDKLEQLSTDDTLDRRHPAGPRNHALTQSLGGTVSRLSVVPHTKSLALDTSDRILLCSDGLTDMLSDADIFTVLSARPEHPAQALVSAALRAGGRDNVTVVLIDKLMPASA